MVPWTFIFFLHKAKRMKLGNPYLAVIFSQMCANRLQWQCKIWFYGDMWSHWHWENMQTLNKYIQTVPASCHFGFPADLCTCAFLEVSSYVYYSQEFSVCVPFNLMVLFYFFSILVSWCVFVSDNVVTFISLSHYLTVPRWHCRQTNKSEVGQH